MRVVLLVFPLIVCLLALALSTEIHFHLAQKESDEGGHDYHDYQLGRAVCPVRSSAFTSFWAPGSKILPASGNFRDITTKNWAYCSAICAITTNCYYWAWNKELHGDDDVGPPGTCILQTQIPDLAGGLGGGTQRQYTGIIHGSSRCKPGNAFKAICETYEPVLPAQCQRHADCAGANHCVAVRLNATQFRLRVNCDGVNGNRCRRNVCKLPDWDNVTSVGCEAVGCVNRQGRLNGNTRGIIMQLCNPEGPHFGNPDAIRRRQVNCTHTKQISYDQCANKCKGVLGCEYFTWFSRDNPERARCENSGQLVRDTLIRASCTNLYPPTTKCWLHDSGKGYTPADLRADSVQGVKWYTGNYLCGGTADDPQTDPIFNGQGTRLTPISGLGNKWEN